MIWHPMKDLFHTRGSVCVTETPTGLNLRGDARKDSHADNFTCGVCPQLSTSMAKMTGEVCARVSCECSSPALFPLQTKADAHRLGF